MAEYTKVGTLANMSSSNMLVARMGARQIVVFRAGEAFYATDNICSHEYAELHTGWYEPEDCTIECPLHGSRFDIRTGQALTLPAYRPIATYPVQIDGEDVLVAL